jgi:5-dehydro-2-deoxygluconokinase
MTMAMSADDSAAFELITMGRVGVDIYPEQVGVGLEDVISFRKYLGGTATNVAVAAARHGHRCAVITRTGDDPFGRYVHKALRGFGVDDRYVSAVDGLPTPVVFCEIFPPDDFPIYFYRQPKAPDLEIYPDELDLDAIVAAHIFWVTGTGLSAEPSREATMAALEARSGPGHHGITILDLDYRAMFWPSRDAAHEAIGEAMDLVDGVVGNLDECDVAVGARDPEEAARRFLESGLAFAIVKQGPAGVLGVGDDWVVVPPVPVEVVNGLGAGDAFGGAFCHGLLSGWEMKEILQFANAAGALVAGQLACADAMPTSEEVEAFLAESAS